MPEVIRSVAGKCEAEKVIEKSRFIAYSAHVTSEEEAREFVGEIRAKRRDATHNCFGFVADKTGALQRFSDDGEPQGTAGMPILDVIKNKGLFETAVVVTRYFGGIKLGAGGLVRAYTSCTAEVLERAEICLWQMCAEVEIVVDYPQTDGVMKFLSEHFCVRKGERYAEKVTFTVLVKSSEEEAFRSLLTDYLFGRVALEKKGEYFYPFPERSPFPSI
jgi:uncharacterized YigZ family protein